MHCITSRAIKISTVDSLNEELDDIFNVFSSLGYPEILIKHTIKATQTKINSLPIFGLHPCPV